MWRLWNLSKTFGTRPSELMGISDDGLTAYHLDSAVWAFGTELDAALKQAVDPPRKGKNSKPPSPAQQHQNAMRVLEKWLGVKGLVRYRDPAIGTGDR